MRQHHRLPCCRKFEPWQQKHSTNLVSMYLMYFLLTKRPKKVKIKGYFFSLLLLKIPNWCCGWMWIGCPCLTRINQNRPGPLGTGDHSTLQRCVAEDCFKVLPAMIPKYSLLVKGVSGCVPKGVCRNNLREPASHMKVSQGKLGGSQEFFPDF